MHSFQLINNIKLADHYYMYHPSGGSGDLVPNPAILGKKENVTEGRKAGKLVI